MTDPVIVVGMYNMAHCPGQHNLGGNTTWKECLDHFSLACLVKSKRVGPGLYIHYKHCGNILPHTAAVIMLATDSQS